MKNNRKYFSLLSLIFAGHMAQARTIQFKPFEGSSRVRSENLIQLKSAELNELLTHNTIFTKISTPESTLNRNVGTPELPVKSYLLVGRPENINVNVKILQKETVSDVRPAPVQPQDCRCKDVPKPAFTYNRAAYKTQNSAYALEYLGAFRGTPVTRLDIRLAGYNASTNTTEFRTAVEVSHNTKNFEFTRGEYNDYLIVLPEGFEASMQAFVDWKRSRGYNVVVASISSAQKTTAAISEVIRNAYTQSGTDFVILVGNENVLPMFMAQTSGSSQTPSDLKYFTMDGPNDNIPDMFSSRIAANTAEAAAEQIGKTLDFEKKSGNIEGFNKVIGIASNEGSNPSDDEYVTSIETRMNQTLGTTSIHLQQDNPDSNPRTLNNNFNSGAFWLTYLGHGSGTSWPSLNQQYSTQNIKQIRNAKSVKSIIIDVACQNGRLVPGHLGTTFLEVNPGGNVGANGAVAYFGGTVNISWHPPAIMARGIAFEHMDKNYKHLGEALLAGQLYLAKNWNSQNDIVDNLEWYVLQGDPGIQVNF